MKEILNFLLTVKNKSTSKSIGYKNFLIDSYNGLYMKGYFKEILTIEMKRVQHSNSSLYLMLLYVKNVPEKKSIKKIVATISKVTRETDIKGWYETDSTVGIIFTDIDEEKSERSFEDIIHNKIYHSISSTSEGKYINKIDISFHRFDSVRIKNSLKESLNVSSNDMSIWEENNTGTLSTY